MLTYFERKSRLPFGAVTKVAKDEGVAPSTVTHVLKGVHRNRKIEIALSALMRPATPVVTAFGAPGPERIRPEPAAAAAVPTSAEG